MTKKEIIATNTFMASVNGIVTRLREYHLSYDSGVIKHIAEDLSEILKLFRASIK